MVILDNCILFYLQGILMVPWNYSPCVLVAASWCLTHSTPISTQ